MKNVLKILSVDTEDTTFIFVVLKIWNHRKSIEELINESKLKYKWKDISIIDAAKIALWLEHYPAISIWLREK